MGPLDAGINSMLQALVSRYAPSLFTPGASPGAEPKAPDASPVDLDAILRDVAAKNAPAPAAPRIPSFETKVEPAMEPAVAPFGPPSTPRAAPSPAAPADGARREPTLLSGIGSFLSGLGRGNGALLPALGGGIQGVQGDNATFRALRDKGLSEDLALAAMNSPALMANALSPKTQVINNKLVETATGRVIGDFSDSASKGPDVHKFSLPGGEEVSGVYDPTRKRFTLPDGRELPIGETPKDIPPGVDAKTYRKTMADKLGEAKAGAITKLPEALRASEEAVKLIDDILAHPSFDKAIGPIDGIPWVPSVMPGTRDVEAKIGQLQGKTFMQAYDALRGAGAITEQEGKSAIASFNRLAEKRVDEADYKTALADAKRELLQLREIAVRKSKGDFTPLAPEAKPAAAAEGATIVNPETGERRIMRGGKWERL